MAAACLSPLMRPRLTSFHLTAGRPAAAWTQDPARFRRRWASPCPPRRPYLRPRCLRKTLKPAINIKKMPNATTGRLGELVVEQQLLELEPSWRPVRLDTAQMAANADLLALRRERRVSLQVKTTDARTRHSHSHALFFGHSAAYLRSGQRIFNSKSSPFIADIVVGVSYNSADSRFVVLPVAFAEKLCRCHCDYWFDVPTKSGGRRSPSFLIYLCFTAPGSAHTQHHEKMMRNLSAFENRWDILSEPIDRLHDETAWNLI